MRTCKALIFGLFCASFVASQASADSPCEARLTLPIAIVTEKALTRGQLNAAKLKSLIEAEVPVNPFSHDTPTTSTSALSAFYQSVLAKHLSDGSWAQAKAELQRIYDKLSGENKSRERAAKQTRAIISPHEKWEFPGFKVSVARTRLGKSFLISRLDDTVDIYDFMSGEPIYTNYRSNFYRFEDLADGSVNLKLYDQERGDDKMHLETRNLTSGQIVNSTFPSKGYSLPPTLKGTGAVDLETVDERSATITIENSQTNFSRTPRNWNFSLFKTPDTGGLEPIVNEPLIFYSSMNSRPQILELTDGRFVAAGNQIQEEHLKLVYYPPFKDNLTQPVNLQSQIEKGLLQLKLTQTRSGRVFVSVSGVVGDSKRLEIFEPAVSANPFFVTEEPISNGQFDWGLFESEGELYLVLAKGMRQFSILSPGSGSDNVIAEFKTNRRPFHFKDIAVAQDGEVYMILQSENKEITKVISLLAYP